MPVPQTIDTALSCGHRLTGRSRNGGLYAQPLPFGGVGNLDDTRGGCILSVPIGECSRQVELPDSRDPVLGEQRQCNNLRRRAVGGHVPESIQNGSKLHYQEKARRADQSFAVPAWTLAEMGARSGQRDDKAAGAGLLPLRVNRR